MGQLLASRFFQAQAAQSMSGMAAGGGVPGGEADGPNNPDATWWCKLLGRVVGVLGGIVAFTSGLATLVIAVPTLSIICVIAGLLLMLLAIVVLVFEAPMCCVFFNFTKPIATFAEKRTYIQKAIIYCAPALIIFFLCFGLSMLFGCVLIFASGVVYGLMGIGKKGDRQQMGAAPAGADVERPASRPDDTRAGLINDDVMRADQFVSQR